MNETTKVTAQLPYVGYVAKRYPRFSETFIVNEILAHERAGMKIDIFALGPVEETHFQDSISKVKGPLTRFRDKQRNVDAFWKLLMDGNEVLPQFNERIAKFRDGNAHEVAQAIMMAMTVRARGIEHLHAHFGTRATTVARMAAYLANIGYSFTAHAKDIYFPYEEATNMATKLADAAQTITVSDYNLAYLQDRYGAAADKTVRLYNGLELDRFSYNACETRPRHILAVGRLVAKKGFEVLIDAMAILRDRKVDVQCSIVGNGDLRKALQERIDALTLGDYIELTGQMPQPDIIRAMQNTSMVVAPCVVSKEGDRDGLPTVLLEAMAIGAPVISTRVAGIPELVRDGETGLCVEPHDAVALADAMQRLLEDKALQNSLSKQARTLIEQEFDIEKNAARQREIFVAAVAQHKATV